MVESGAVCDELRVDRPPPVVGVVLRRVDHVQQQVRALEVREELVAKADGFARALDQSGMSATTSWRPSDDSTVPSTGASVVNGYSATFGRALEMRVSSDDLPAFGSPTSAASASSFSRSSISPSSPVTPTSANRGV